MWFIGVKVEQETSALAPKKNPGSSPENDSQNCLTRANVKTTWLGCD